MVNPEDDIKELKGVGAKTAENLEENGRGTIKDLAIANPDDLPENTSLGEKKANDLVNKAREALRGGSRYQNGLDFEKDQKNMGTISTGSEKFDSMLGGGIGVEYLTEAYGLSSSGKCVTGDTPVIYKQNGETKKKPIKQIFEEKNAELGETEVNDLEALAYNQEKKRLEHQDISKLWKQEVDKTIKIETGNGRKIEGTPDHPVLVATENGLTYKKLRNIQVEDQLATPKKNSFENNSSYSRNEAYFLGLYTAEGGKNPYAVNTGKGKLKNFVKNFCEDNYGFTPTVNNDRMLLRENMKNFTGDKLNKKSVEKEAPRKIFNQSRETIAAYLGGYLDGDGAKSEDGSLSFTTGSEKLFEDIAYLLQLTGFTVSKQVRKIDGDTYFRGRIKTTENSEKIPSKLGRDYNEESMQEQAAPKEVRSMLRSFYEKEISQGSGISKAELPEEGKEVFGTENLEDGLNKKSLEKAEEWLDKLQHKFLKLESEKFCNGTAFKQAVNKTPVTTKEIADRLQISESTLTNYKMRGVPDEAKRKEVQVAYRKLSRQYKNKARKMRKQVKLMRNTGFDKVTKKEVIEKPTTVYDFVVPESHSFIAGNLPTANHNTQLAFQLSVNAQLPEEKGGADNGDQVIFIDVEETFRADRIRQLAKANGQDPEKVLSNIHVARPTDLSDQEQTIREARQLPLDDVALIVIDSIVGHVRAEFEGREEYGERADRIGNMLNELQKFASGETGHEIAVFYTNQAGKDPAVQYGDPVYAYGPSTLEHRSSFRLRLDSRGSKGYNAELVDSPNLPQKDVYFDVYREGVRDQEFESEANES